MAYTTSYCLPAKSAVGSVCVPHYHARNAASPSILIKLGVSCSGTILPSSRLACQRSRYLRGVQLPSAAISSQPELDDDEDIGLDDGDSTFDESALGPPPDIRYQPEMHIKDRKAWRAKAETMAKEKRLINVQIGQLGITPSFLCAAADVLQKHSLVRVKLGEGCGLERRSAAELLEKYLDCVCVHKIGFTITLYRQPGLPRPSNTVRESDGEKEAAEVAALHQKATARAAAAQEKQRRKQAGQHKPQERPPEFSLL